MLGGSGSALALPARTCALIAACAAAGCSDPSQSACATSPGAACASPDASADSEPAVPFVIHYVPNSGDTVAPEVVVSATFNKPVVNVSTFSFKLTRRDTDSWYAAYVSYDEQTRTALLVPTPPLERGRTYVATLTPDIVDMHGTQLVGTTSWVFTVEPDTTPPAVTTTSPPADAVGIAVDTIVVARFSEDVLNASRTSFVLTGSNGSVMTTFNYITKNTVSLTPTLQLAPNTIYRASLSSAITDAAYNPLLAAPYEWSFTTGADTVPPALTYRFPEIDDFGIPLTGQVSVRFSEAVTGVSTTTMTLDQAGALVPASVTYIPTSRTARLAPAALLAPNTLYTVTLSTAITDASGNAPAAPITWSFTTGPN